MSRRSPVRAPWRATVAVVAGVLAVAGCTAGGERPVEPAPTPSASAPTSEAAPEWTVEELSDAVLTQEEAVLASVEGELAYQEDPVRVRFDVLAVDAGEDATVLRMRMTALGDGEDVTTMDAYLSPDGRMHHDIRGIALQVPEQGVRFQPTLTTRDADPEQRTSCLCSNLSEAVDPDTPFLFTATFPPLDASTETVDLELVGFPLVSAVPVDRT